MNETAIVTGAARTVHNRIRMSTTAEGSRLLEELRAVYQKLGREERQQIKNLMLTLSKTNGIQQDSDHPSRNSSNSVCDVQFTHS